LAWQRNVARKGEAEIPQRLDDSKKTCRSIAETLDRAKQEVKELETTRHGKMKCHGQTVDNNRLQEKLALRSEQPTRLQRTEAATIVSLTIPLWRGLRAADRHFCDSVRAAVSPLDRDEDNDSEN
jgi:phage terminase large subunit-like protein